MLSCVQFKLAVSVATSGTDDTDIHSGVHRNS